MAPQPNDLGIDQLLADSLVRSLMRADRVDPIQLEAMLRGVADRLHGCANGPRPSGQRRAAGSFPHYWEAARRACLRPPSDRTPAAKSRPGDCSFSACW